MLNKDCDCIPQLNKICAKCKQRRAEEIAKNLEVDPAERGICDGCE